MRKNKLWYILPVLCLLLCLPQRALAEEGIAIDEVNFPDEYFRQQISAMYDKNTDGIFSQEELEAVENLDLQHSSSPIQDLSGIEHFPNLELLYCQNNAIYQLDLSANTKLQYLYCQNNELTTLDVSQNTALTVLECGNNQLTALDVSANVALRDLYCYDNRISVLDLQGNTELRRLDIADNALTVLELGSLTHLLTLDCSDNLLEVLDVSQNKYLVDLNCSYNQISELRFYNLLEILSCGGNKLQSLDVSSCTRLSRLNCCENMLTSLAISPSAPLTELAHDGNRFTIELTPGGSFDLSGLPGFDASKASHWAGGTVDGSILTVDADATEVRYSYNCGNNMACSFTLVPIPHEHSFGAWETVEAPGCETSGTEQQVCSSCQACNTRAIEALGHTYESSAEWIPSAEGHSKKCARCGAKSDSLPHIPGPGATETEPQLCTECQYILQPATGHVNHSYTVLQFDSTHHWYKCSGCNQISQKAEHDGGAASCTGRATCTTCGALYGNLTEHSYTVLQSDSTHHWYRCQGCEAIEYMQEHSFDDQGICALCGYADPSVPPATEPVPSEPEETEPSAPATEPSHPTEPPPTEPAPEKEGGQLWIFLCGVLSAAVIALAVLLLIRKKKEDCPQ